MTAFPDREGVCDRCGQIVAVQQVTFTTYAEAIPGLSVEYDAPLPDDTETVDLCAACSGTGAAQP